MIADTGEYANFIRRKSQVGTARGFEPLWMPDFLKDFQRYLAEWSIRGGRGLLGADCGLGKAQRIDQRILTDAGWKQIGDAKVGMRVYGSDGCLHDIIGVYPQGVKQLACVRFSDGSEVVCDWEHLWYTESQQQAYQGRRGTVKTTAEIFAKGIEFKGGQKKNFIPLIQPLSLPSRLHVIDPYTLGVMIGDGGMTHGNCRVACPDFEFTADELPLPAGCQWSRKVTPGRCKTFSIIGGEHWNSPNPVTVELRRLGLQGLRSEQKFVPHEYLYAATETRLALLQGLLDTDGHAAGPCIEYTTASRQLSDDVLFLVRSLGGTATLSQEPAHYTKDGNRVDCLDKYRSVVKLPARMAPFRLARKANAYTPVQRKNPLKSIVEISEAGQGEAICIAVNAPDCLYVTEGFTLTHNTPMSLVWAENVVRHTNRPVLILAPLGVSHQTVREASKFGVEAHRSADGKACPNITVTNYERLDKFNPDDYSGVVCDEASILKHWSGATQKTVTRFLSKVPYRLLCTATPAPNDYIELGTLSEALGELTYTEMLGIFFRQLSDDEKKRRATVDDIIHSKRLSWRVLQSFGQWALRPHAFEPFWKWVASWARACRKPSDLGPFSDTEFTLPALNRRDHVITPRTAPPGYLFTVPAFGLNQERGERRRTLDERSELVVNLTKDSDSAVVWCYLNDEADRLGREIKGAVEVKGSQSADEKEELILAFLNQQARVLVTKPKIAGLGLNLQHCAHVVTFVTHSYEQFRQLIGRCHRFGQKRTVTLDVIATEGEVNVKKNMERKEKLASLMFDSIIQNMNDAVNVKAERAATPVSVPQWLAN